MLYCCVFCLAYCLCTLFCFVENGHYSDSLLILNYLSYICSSFSLLILFVCEPTLISYFQEDNKPLRKRKFQEYDDTDVSAKVEEHMGADLANVNQHGPNEEGETVTAQRHVAWDQQNEGPRRGSSVRMSTRLRDYEA